MSEAVAAVTFEVFLAAEERSERRHEYVGGRVYAMAGGTERHDLLTGLMYEAVAAAARAGGCRPFAGNRLVRTPSGSAYYPDVVVVCGPAADRRYEADATLVVEVLSASTEDTDRREKAVAYAGLASLRAYMLVHQDRRLVEVGVPWEGGLRWDTFGAGDVVMLPHATVDIDALYDELDRTSSTG